MPESATYVTCVEDADFPCVDGLLTCKQLMQKIKIADCLKILTMYLCMNNKGTDKPMHPISD